MLYEPKLTFTKIVPATDTHFAVPFAPIVDSASLLLHLDGAQGSTTITDATGRHTLLANGNAQLDTSDSRFGSGSLLLDGAADFLTTPGGGNDFAYGTGNFTIDFWIKFNSVAPAQQRMYSAGVGTDPDKPYIDLLGATQLINYGFNSINQIVGTTPLTTAVWYHIAVARSGTNTKLFLNGTQEGGTLVDGTNFSNADSLDCPRFGSNSGGASNVSGRFDEIRIVKGAAMWTANFIPPNCPYTPPPP